MAHVKWYQRPLPLGELKCGNPSCTNTAPTNSVFCGMDCYEVMRVDGLRPREERKSPMKKVA